jgi:DNA-binding response OmpR family regulator
MHSSIHNRLAFAENCCPSRYDEGQRLLFREGELVALAPKALETLHVLLERRGRAVDKNELMKLVWPDTAELNTQGGCQRLRRTPLPPFCHVTVGPRCAIY